MGEEPLGLHPHPLAGADAGLAGVEDADRPVAADVLAVGGGHENDVEGGHLLVGIERDAGPAHSVSRARDVGAEDAVADGSDIVDRLGDACPDQIRLDADVKIGSDELPPHRFHQSRGLAGVLQPA